MRISALCALLFFIAGCEQAVQTREVPVGRTPQLLSEWQMLEVTAGRLVVKDHAVPYDLNTPLFSDYAQKLRTIRVPQGHPGQYKKDESFEFPVGTVLTKTFYYPLSGDDLVTGIDPYTANGLDLSQVRLIETRVLVKRRDGWEGLPYVWNQAQSDARLLIAGDIQRLTVRLNGNDQTFNYIVPTKNECASCHGTNHATRELLPIGTKARHLNKTFGHYNTGPADQLRYWVSRGLLTDLPDEEIPRAAHWLNEHEPLDALARSYLDINCGHCHSPVGPADTSGLFLHAQETSERRLGVCKPPIASGRGSGGRQVSIVPGNPEASILAFRVNTSNPAEMMPEIGRSLVHREGVSIISRWIESLSGEC